VVSYNNLIDNLDSYCFPNRCEYILYRNLYRTAYARLSRGKITDTELQIGQFVLPKYGHQVVNETEEARYLRSFKEDLPEAHVSNVEVFLGLS
jgi:hypothetical protein